MPKVIYIIIIVMPALPINICIIINRKLTIVLDDKTIRI